METEFAFSTDVVPVITKEIASAEKYVRIAMFQIHREDVFEALTKKLTDKVRVEIFTLPYDSINDNLRTEVERKFNDLANSGAIIYFNKWNVGDP